MSYTKEDIYEYLSNIMEELFEIDASNVKPDARLFDDLDIDSIDAVDMMVKLKSFTGKKISPSEFKDVRTVQDIVDAVYKLIHQSDHEENSGQLRSQPE